MLTTQLRYRLPVKCILAKQPILHYFAKQKESIWAFYLSMKCPLGTSWVLPLRLALGPVIAHPPGSEACGGAEALFLCLSVPHSKWPSQLWQTYSTFLKRKVC